MAGRGSGTPLPPIQANAVHTPQHSPAGALTPLTRGFVLGRGAKKGCQCDLCQLFWTAEGLMKIQTECVLGV